MQNFYPYKPYLPEIHIFLINLSIKLQIKYRAQASSKTKHDLNKYTNKEKQIKHIFILLEACAGSTISRFVTSFWGGFSRGVPRDAVLLAK